MKRKRKTRAIRVMLTAWPWLQAYKRYKATGGAA